MKVTRIETLRCDAGWRMFSFLEVATPGVETRSAVRGADEFAVFIKTEVHKWTKVIEAARLKAR